MVTFTIIYFLITYAYNPDRSIMEKYFIFKTVPENV